MIIKHTNYTNGVHEIEFNEPVSKVGLEEPFFGNVEVKCRMDKSSYQIVLDIIANAEVEFECDRCTKEFESTITGNFKLVCLYKEEDVSDEDINIIYLPPEQDKINISDDVVEYLLLNIPMKKICKDDCKGLCPHCGTDLNEKTCKCNENSTNPVWEPLLKLKEKLNNN